MGRGKRILALVTDAYGGHGGIALYARDSLAAMAADPRVSEVIVLPRLIGSAAQQPPAKILQDCAAAKGSGAYVRRLATQLAQGRFDAIWAAHIHLSPLAFVAARASKARFGLVLHGVEAWTPAPRRSIRFAAVRADLIMPVSRVTERRFRAAYGSIQRALVCPGAVDLDSFTPGPRSATLAARLTLDGRRMLMTLGRLDPGEQAKGFDRIIALMPQLIQRYPNLCYLVCGDGGDRERLSALASCRGVEKNVIFAGRIPEEDKADTFRLADAYVMPSVMEGLGIVLLEALACGVPSIASSADGSCEAVADGRGEAVDPFDADALLGAIGRALEKPHRRPPGLDYFGVAAFRARTTAMLDDLLGDA